MSSIDNPQYYTTSTNIRNFKPLQYSNNSCYIDSVLTALFAPSNNANLLKKLLLYDVKHDNRLNICCDNINISKDIRLSIQKELSIIYLSINNSKNYDVKNVNKLKQLFRHCNHVENYSNNGMKDPSEFANYIFDLFNISCVKNQHVYGILENSKLKLLDKNNDTSGSVFITHILNETIKLDKLITQNEYNKVNFTRNNTNFIGTFTVRELVESPFIIFHIQRITLGKRFNLNRVVAPDIICLNNLKYTLSAVVVFNSNHYTTFFKRGLDWYYYDDTSEYLVKQFDIKQIETKGVLYFYY